MSAPDLATVIARAGRIIGRRGLDPDCWITTEAWHDPKHARVDIRTALMIGLRRPQWEWYGMRSTFANALVRDAVELIGAHLVATGAAPTSRYPSVMVARWELRCGSDQARTVLQDAADVLRRKAGRS